MSTDVLLSQPNRAAEVFKEGIEALRGETCCDEGACH